LKYLKTAKTFLGNPWHWNRTSSEMFGEKAWMPGTARRAAVELRAFVK
jgi:hypothetical protein